MGFVVDKAAHTHHHPSSGAGTTDQIVTRPSGLSLTPLQETEGKLAWYSKKHVVGYQRPDLMADRWISYHGRI
jgi:hypothetical protein